MNEIEKTIEELKSLKGICLYAEDGQPPLAAIKMAKVYELAISALEAQQADVWIPITESLPAEATQCGIYLTMQHRDCGHRFTCQAMALQQIHMVKWTRYIKQVHNISVDA